MGKLTVTEFTTLDGVGQAPGEPGEDRDSNFTYGGWQAPLVDQGSGAGMFEQARNMDALLLGRKTYEIFAGYWPRAPGQAAPLPDPPHPLPMCRARPAQHTGGQPPRADGRVGIPHWSGG